MNIKLVLSLCMLAGPTFADHCLPSMVTPEELNELRNGKGQFFKQPVLPYELVDELLRSGKMVVLSEKLTGERMRGFLTHQIEQCKAKAAKAAEIPLLSSVPPRY